MADLKNLKNRKTKPKNRFGKALDSGDVSTTLEQPEVAPLAEPVTKGQTKRKTRKVTGRTVSWGTRVSPEFDAEFKQVAFDNGFKKVELLEQMLEVYKKRKR